MLGRKSPQRAAKTKASLEDQEIDAERACPHPGGDGGLGRAVEAPHHGDPRNAAEHHRDFKTRNETPQRGERAHEREAHRREADDRVYREPALHTRQAGRTDDGAETETAEQRTVAQSIEAEIPTRDDRQQGPERAPADDEEPGSNQHGDERRGVARVTYPRPRRADDALGGQHRTRRLTPPSIHDDDDG